MNRLCFGDNLKWLSDGREFPDASVDLMNNRRCFEASYGLNAKELAAYVEKGSGIPNDPDRGDKPDYIANLIGKIITVSLETGKLIARLPKLEI